MGRSIMIQGTMSNAGKSLLVTALCRILREDGYSCAPFKSQNMALNSFVTAEGLEMGRAQALQAEAAGIAPSVAMNPILLKPTSDVGSQVIVNGVPVGNMTAAEYFRKKRELLPVIKDAYSSLAAAYDIVVIEGAGSPAELNLKSDDIVNMGVARLAKAPVLLVGDIDRGGVFAQLLGTLSLLEADERKMVKALVVNKFRGDREFFRDGVEILEQRGGIPVAGVIPYIRCDLEDEDSLSEKLADRQTAPIDIAVIRLPRISNFTDLDVFGQFAEVSVRYVTSPGALGEPDLIILPGTKSTISDLRFLRESGFDTRVKQAARKIPIVGICGGYQLLGREISDPHGAEGGGSEKGLGLLETNTVFSEKKTTGQVTGRFCGIPGFFGCLSGAEFSGYEIHHGVTENDGKPLAVLDGGREDGAFSENVIGTYVHGIFDSADVCGRLVKALCERKGLPYTGAANVVSREEYRRGQLDLLAAEVRKNLDMPLIRKIIKEGI